MSSSFRGCCAMQEKGEGFVEWHAWHVRMPRCGGTLVKRQLSPANQRESKSTDRDDEEVESEEEIIESKKTHEHRKHVRSSAKSKDKAVMSKPVTKKRKLRESPTEEEGMWRTKYLEMQQGMRRVVFPYCLCKFKL